MTRISSENLLRVKDLVVHYRTLRGEVQAVRRVSFDIRQGERLGIIGESGCGKSSLARALVRLLPRNGFILSGEIIFKGRNLLELSQRQMRSMRWKEIASIPQAAMDSLDPVQRVGRQLEEILRVRGGMGRHEARRRAATLFEQVGLDDRLLARYPHEFSGGMKQRAVIAMALSLNPSLLIADEPVTALDNIVQNQILELLRRLQREMKLTLLLITHDVSAVSGICDSIGVMYAGQIVELSPVVSFFSNPYHPYSMGLQLAMPTLMESPKELFSIPGHPPDLSHPPRGCSFSSRCTFGVDQCEELEPQRQEMRKHHWVSCLRAGEMDAQRRDAPHAERRSKTPIVAREGLDRRLRERPGSIEVGFKEALDPMNNSQAGGIPLLKVDNVFKRYRLSRGWAGRLSEADSRTVHAVNGVSFELARGESLGLAGESGCGKTTLGKLLVKLQEPSRGHVVFDSRNLSGLSKVELKSFRRRVQLMFQNPAAALNPQFTIHRSLAEPLIIHGWNNDKERLNRILDTLDRVHLHPPRSALDKYPHQLSGGQLQRVVLARAFVLQPDLMIADEPVSMVDVSVRAGILNTMRIQAAEMGLTTLYISHDLSWLQLICERIAVMYLGKIMEIGPTRQIMTHPEHPYTQALVSAIPSTIPGRREETIPIRPGAPNAMRTPAGCPFQDRCPELREICRWEAPPWIKIGAGHQVACHLHGPGGESPRIVPPMSQGLHPFQPEPPMDTNAH